MSTNHTPNYSLSQWQASDQVLRTDFNEDNAKLEAALSSLEERVAELYRAVPNLAYHVGQLTVIDELDRQTYLTQRAMTCEPFFDADLYTCTGGVVIADNQATLTGAGNSGAVTFQRLPTCAQAWKKVRLWTHQRGGTVVPKINGVAMESVGTAVVELSILGKAGVCREYVCEPPHGEGNVEITLEMICGSSTLVHIYDCCIAYF